MLPSALAGLKFALNKSLILLGMLSVLVYRSPKGFGYALGINVASKGIQP